MISGCFRLIHRRTVQKRAAVLDKSEINMNDTHFSNVQVMRNADEGSDLAIRKFQKFIEEKHHIKFTDYWDLHKWTVDKHVDFWEAAWEFFGVISSKKYDEVIDPNLPIYETSAWFKGARLNYAENLLKYRDDGVALITAGEDIEVERTTYAQLYEEAELYSAAFRKCGLKKGDVVACYMSNRKEAVVAMLGAVSIGAIWTGALPLLGSEACCNRLRQVNPKFLITIDRYLNEGQKIKMLPKVKAVAEALKSLEKIIIVPSRGKSNLPDISDIKNSCFLSHFLDGGREKDGSIPPIKFEQVPASHPVYICFTSGTTGLPKALVHGFGALMMTTLCWNVHFNSNRDSIWLSISPVGWASWNMFSSVLFIGLTIVLFESSPYYLSPTFFWDLVEDLKITHVFVAASVIDELQKRRYLPTKRHSLAALKYILSGGSVVKPHNYDFIYEEVGKDIRFCGSYGCTETMGTTLVMDPYLPVHKGEIPAIVLGCNIEVVDDTGNPVVGEVGRLVLSKPIPGLPLGLLGDSDGSVFKEKYFSKFPGRFDAGDFGILNPVTKGWLICGRSDDTLKQRGCRFGSSEIYNVVEKFPEVRDSLCVSKYNKQMDESAVLFLKIRINHTFSDDLVKRIREAIARELTVRHVPDFILEAPDIPYNINGKKMEILVKNIINKRPYNVENIKNVESLNFFSNVPELQDF